MPAQGGPGFTGVVVSGTGNTYMVQLTNQPTTPTVPATVPQIDSSQTVPAGTSVLLMLIGGNYYFQVPVWLTPA